jgi:1-acyl-sn-glycerol-3-phosphate acyltransferase
VKFAVFFWKTVGQMIGLQVRVIGVPARTEGEGRRPVIYACNHSSWLDIPALGGMLKACFVSKDDVAGWPVIGTIARLGRSVFVSRARQNIGRERDDMQARLARAAIPFLFFRRRLWGGDAADTAGIGGL